MKVLKGHKSACLTAGILMQGHPLPCWQSANLNIVLEFTLNTTNKQRSLKKKKTTHPIYVSFTLFILEA